MKLALETDQRHSLFQEPLRVPLTVASPRVRAGSHIGTRVHLPDLCPTVLELAETGSAPELGAGASFAALVRGGAAPERSLYPESMAHSEELRAMVNPTGYTLIRATHPDERGLQFDLAFNPLAMPGEGIEAADLGELQDFSYGDSKRR